MADRSTAFLTEQQIMIRDAARRLAAGVVAPTAAERDRTSAWPHAELKTLANGGFLGMLIPEEYGGVGAGFVEFCLAQHEFAAVDAGLATILHVHNITAMCIAANGTEAQKRAYLPAMARGEAIGATLISEPQAGSDTAALRATAQRDGDCFVLNGTKQFVSNGSQAGVAVVLAQTDKSKGKKGWSTFVIDPSQAGYQVSRIESKLGQHTAHTAQIVFDNFRAPATSLLAEEGSGYSTILGSLSDGRIGIAFIAAGAARGAWKLRFSMRTSARFPERQSSNCRASHSIWPTWLRKSTWPFSIACTRHGFAKPAWNAARKPPLRSCSPARWRRRSARRRCRFTAATATSRISRLSAITATCA